MQDKLTQSDIWRPLPCRGSNAQLFVIGDVHGQADVLAFVLDEIASVPQVGLERHLVFLGDLIDRGPNSIGAVDLAMRAADRARVDEVFLLPGNHELMLIDGILDPEAFIVDWLDNGGDAVINEADPHCKVRKLAGLAEIARAAFDPAFLSIMISGPTFYQAGELLLVHAGLDPEMDPDVFLNKGRFGAAGSHWAWIREDFLDWQYGWGPERSWVVIHGHTPTVVRKTNLERFARSADLIGTHRRLCLDAGAALGISQIGWAEFRQHQYRISLTSIDV